MTIRAISIPFDSDKPVEIIDLDRDNTLEQLRQLNALVDGGVQCVPLQPAFPGVTLWVNEEGKSRFPEELGRNSRAQRLWDRAWGELTDFIVGNAVLLGGADDDGNTTGLDDEQYAAVAETLDLSLTVRFENAYGDGHSSVHTLLLPAPGADIDEWWEDEVFPHTGDSHGIGSAGSCLTATVIAGPTNMLGMSNEWLD